MCITNAWSPAGVTLLSSGIDQLIDSSTRRTQKPIYHRQGFYPASAAAAFTGRKSIYSYQLIRQQVTTEIREHARYKPKLWLEEMETLMLMWAGIGGGGTLRRGQLRKACVTLHYNGPDGFSIVQRFLILRWRWAGMWNEFDWRLAFLCQSQPCCLERSMEKKLGVHSSRTACSSLIIDFFFFLGCRSSNLFFFFSSSKLQAKKKKKIA